MEKPGRAALTKQERAAVYRNREDIRDDLVERLSKRYGITTKDLMGDSRIPEIVAARHEVIRTLHERGLSASEVGRLMGRDHSTVLAVLSKARAT
jgi:chromosomal replication initiation ATPase DnaA